MNALSSVRIGYLIDYPDLVDELAGLHFAEWSYLRPDETLAERNHRLRLCCGRSGVPTVLVAVAHGRICGSAMLVAHDMETRPELSPWLAGVYVVPAWRRKGLGAALIQRAVDAATAAGVKTLYLYTPGTEALYARLGCAVIERCKFRGVEVSLMSRHLAA